MTTVDPSTDPTRRGAHADPALPDPRPGRAWAWAGALGGAVGLVGLMVTGSLYDASTGVVADNAALAAAVTGNAALVWAQQVVCAVVVGCLLVFAAGLRRHLARQEPAGSLLPGVAAGGVLLTAAAVLVGGGISTELYWALIGDQPFDPDTIGAHLAVYNTTAWLWGALAVSAVAVSVAGLRRGSVGRVLAVVSGLLGLLIAATQLVPVQYISVVPGGVWLVLAGTGLAVSGRGRAGEPA